MQTRKLVYKYGHFYDQAAGQRLSLREGANIQIEARERHTKIPMSIFLEIKVIPPVMRWTDSMKCRARKN